MALHQFIDKYNDYRQTQHHPNQIAQRVAQYAELIAKETGCRLIPINPLDYDWSKEMIHIAKSLADGQAD